MGMSWTPARDFMNSALTAAICTRDRPELLARALRSLLAQRRPPLEILVVDNSPSDERTRELLAREFQTVRYVREPVPGLDFARNRAIRESSGRYLAFLDDDAVAGPDWAAANEDVLAESPRIGACMGKVDALTLETAGARLFEANGGFARGDRRIHLPRGTGTQGPGARRPLIAWCISVGSGVSMALRKDLLDRVGGFDDALDLGAALPGGGDLDMIWRVLESGSEVVYEPRVQARHEHRAERAAAELQILEHNRALIATLTKLVAAAGWRWKGSILAFLCWRLVKPFKRLLWSIAGRDPLPPPLLWRLVGFTWRGLVAYPAARRLAAERTAQYGGTRA
jgi:GT2 family glycosyltransferase